MGEGSHLNCNAQRNGINSSFSPSVSEPGHYMPSEGAAFQRRARRVVLCMQPGLLIKGRLTSEGSSALRVILPE